MTVDTAEIKVKCKGGGSIIKHAPIFSPDGQCLYVLWKNVIRCYNVKTGERVADFEGCEDTIIGVRYHPTNSALLVGCSDTGEIAIWKWETRLLISVQKFKQNISDVVSFHLVPSNREKTQCDILLNAKNNEKYHMALFSLEKLELKSIIPIRLPNINYVDIGSVNQSPFIAAADDINLICVKLNEIKKHKVKVGEGRHFTCVTCHPEKDCVATGDSSGRILVWNDFFSKGAPKKAIYHWHTLPVITLAFSQTGTILYSGGNECTIVKWHLDSLNKKFYPRLPAPISNLTFAPGNTYLAISTTDNAIHITDSQFTPKSIIQHLTWSVSHSAGIQIDPRTKSLIMNGYIGNIQFYSPFSTSLLYNLDVVGQNKITDERKAKIPSTNVSKIALTKSGDWLACVEDRIDNKVYQEIRLKFFQFDETNQTFTLNTSVEYPHENGVNSLEFQPPNNATDLLCATNGNDNLFKIWRLVDTSDIYHKSRGWRCWSSASYKSFPSSSLSFSSDGSLLVVAFGSSLTAWSPDTCELKCSLVNPSFHRPLKIVKCGNVDQCHLVVAASTNRLCVWNLLTLTLMWTVPVMVESLCADPLSTYMAAFTQHSGLIIFSPGSSTPVYHHKEINKKKIIASNFVPRINESTDDCAWQRLSQLYFINIDQELLCLESSRPTSESSTLEYNPDVQKTAFGALTAQTTISNTKKQDQVFHLEKGLTRATEVKQLLEPPVHTMAPMRLLCNSVLRSLVIREGELKKENTEDYDAEIDSPDEEVIEVDSDEEFKSKRRIVKMPKPKKEKSKHKKQDLESISSKSYKWTKILLD